VLFLWPINLWEFKMERFNNRRFKFKVVLLGVAITLITALIVHGFITSING